MSNDIVASSEKYGRCERCHRKLKDPDSVKRGLGPICVKKVEAELKEDGKNEMQDLAHALGYSEAGGQ